MYEVTPATSAVLLVRSGMPLGISELVSLLFDLGQHGERDHEKAPCMELSAGNIQQRQYDRNFEYEYQHR
jgi:hypothetical protein